MSLNYMHEIGKKKKKHLHEEKNANNQIRGNFLCKRYPSFMGVE